MLYLVLLYYEVFCGAFCVVVLIVIVIMAVLVIFVIGLVVFLVVRDLVVEGEIIMVGDEVDVLVGVV